MLTLNTIMKDTLWVGKFYVGGRMVGTYDEVSKYDDEFRDLDIACTENQPEYLRDFYEGYFSQHEYYLISDYYDNVYAKEVH